ncbi:unnamed protein product [Caenorhabditis nigoni]
METNQASPNTFPNTSFHRHASSPMTMPIFAPLPTTYVSLLLLDDDTLAPISLIRTGYIYVSCLYSAFVE